MINLFNMDCMEALKEAPDNFWDLAICDPPYGIGIANWDIKPNDNYFKHLFRTSKNQIIWGANYFHLPHTEAWICWHKTKVFKNPAFKTKSDFELAWTSYKHKSKYLGLTYNGNILGFNSPKPDYKKPKNIHPTQKPIALYTWLLSKYGKKGDKILDTHLGSGSSAIAAHKAGYDFWGYEIDKDYFNAAKKRFENHERQIRMF